MNRTKKEPKMSELLKVRTMEEQLAENLREQRRTHGEHWETVTSGLRLVLERQMQREDQENPIVVAIKMGKAMLVSGSAAALPLLMAVATEMFIGERKAAQDE